MATPEQKYKKWKKTLARKALKKLLGLKKFKRDKEYVASEYDTHWKMNSVQWEPRLGLSDGKPVVVKNIDFTKSSVEVLDSFIKKYKPKKVLELGSGIGLMIYALALLNPEVEFTGVELTEEGVKRSKSLEYDTSLLAYLTNIKVEQLNEKIRQCKTNFTVGDITALPFADNSYDFVFSHTVLEQMPYTYQKAFSEAHRVTRSYACFMEEFEEAQRNIWQRMSLYVTDYFHASYHELTKFDFSLISFTTKPTDKASHSLGIALCQKT